MPSTSGPSGVGPHRPAASSVSSRPHQPPRYLRQNTVSGGGGDIHASRVLFSRAISRTYTLTSNASSSIPVEEWRPIFDKLDLESDGRVGFFHWLFP